jgi:hypothetical protein
MTEHAQGELTAAMERAIVRELLLEWRRINGAYFRDALVQPSIELSSNAPLGRWILASRTIEISRAMITTQPWGAVVEVLKHEMAHQFVHEIRGELSESAHGPAFREICARLGIDAAAAGMPTAKPLPDDETTRAVERIARLLALASSPNVHEAEAAMAAAQRLMLKHNIEESQASRAAVRGYAFRHLGKPSGRINEAERILASILGRHFFVEVIWIPVFRPLEGDSGKRGSVLEICGTETNLEIAEYVHSYLTHAAEHAWNEHKREKGIDSNRDRMIFLSGVMTGFADKLAREETRMKAKYRSEGLVWVKDGELFSYFRRRHPHIRNVRYGGARKNDSWEHGKEAGKKIILHRGVGGAPTSRGRLLGPKSE